MVFVNLFNDELWYILHRTSSISWRKLFSAKKLDFYMQCSKINVLIFLPLVRKHVALNFQWLVAFILLVVGGGVIFAVVAADVEEGGAGASRDDGSLCLGNLLWFLLFLFLLVVLLVFLTPHLTHPATPHPTSQQHWHNTLSTTSHHLIKCRLGQHVIKGTGYKWKR